MSPANSSPFALECQPLLYQRASLYTARAMKTANALGESSLAVAGNNSAWTGDPCSTWIYKAEIAFSCLIRALQCHFKHLSMGHLFCRCDRELQGWKMTCVQMKEFKASPRVMFSQVNPSHVNGQAKSLNVYCTSRLWIKGVGWTPAALNELSLKILVGLSYILEIFFLKRRQFSAIQKLLVYKVK